METTSDLMIFRFQNDFRFPKLLLDFRKLELIFEKYLFHPLVLTFRMILFLQLCFPAVLHFSFIEAKQLTAVSLSYSNTSAASLSVQDAG
jgi:hypothetical protein